MAPSTDQIVRSLTLLSGCVIGACVLSGDARTVSASEPGRARQIAPVDPRHAPVVPLKSLHNREQLELQLFDADGQMRTAALTELRDLMRCARTGKDHPIHWRLSTLLVALSAHYPGRVITLVSGFRDPSVSTGTHRSNHTRGRAMDLRIEGVDNRDLRDLIARSFEGVGVGYYPNSSFVHVDIRERRAAWIDYAGPGQRACYSTDVVADLANGSAERLTYAQARSRGCK